VAGPAGVGVNVPEGRFLPGERGVGGGADAVSLPNEDWLLAFSSSRKAPCKPYLLWSLERSSVHGRTSTTFSPWWAGWSARSGCAARAHFFRAKSQKKREFSGLESLPHRHLSENIIWPAQLRSRLRQHCLLGPVTPDRKSYGRGDGYKYGGTHPPCEGKSVCSGWPKP
jgi:hypothetical protein